MQVKPLVAGIAIGLIPSVIIGVTSLTGSSLIDDSPKFLLHPLAEKYDSRELDEIAKYDLSFMNYSDGVVDEKEERFYQRGKDWIIIKDFPYAIDNYAGHYQYITDTTWFK